MADVATADDLQRRRSQSKPLGGGIMTLRTAQAAMVGVGGKILLIVERLIGTKSWQPVFAASGNESRVVVELVIADVRGNLMRIETVDHRCSAGNHLVLRRTAV